MKSDVEIIKIPYQYDRLSYYKDEYPEFYRIIEETKEDIEVRIVSINNKDAEKYRLNKI